MDVSGNFHARNYIPIGTVVPCVDSVYRHMNIMYIGRFVVRGTFVEYENLAKGHPMRRPSSPTPSDVEESEARTSRAI